MQKVTIHCLYCDNKDEADVFSSKVREPQCSKCKETQLLKIIKNSDEKGDYFGYRFDEKESSVEKKIEKEEKKEDNKESSLFGFDWMD